MPVVTSNRNSGEHLCSRAERGLWLQALASRPCRGRGGSEGSELGTQMGSSGRLEGSQRVSPRTKHRTRVTEGVGLRASVFSKTRSPAPFLLRAWQDLEPGQRLLKVLG